MRAYAAMLPRLRAEESLIESQRMAVGTGTSKDPRAIVTGWVEQAGVPRTKPVKATTQDLRAIGIGMRGATATKAHG